ncbi:phosphoenolpyruvate synthase [Candidatus Woesearchaeota archaeon]|nr:phosphoenolpyruvate synthase [Candidatus Woesearchaeota archaeon]
MFMSYVKWFKDITPNDLGSTGGKGLNLGIMYNIGLPVPGGFAVTAQTYELFIKKTGLDKKITTLLKNLNVDDTKELQKRAQQIQDLISSTPMPKDMAQEIMNNYELLNKQEKSKDGVFVAVRSSATAEDLPSASFAGQQATFLNVRGKEQVVKAVLDCWASLFTARAIYYRTRNHFDHSSVLISAIIQKMVNSDQAGIMFTVNPSTNDDTKIVIEAIYGLGEMIVGGEVTPDMYITDKKTGKCIQKEVRKQEIGMFRTAKGGNIRRKIEINLQGLQKISDANIAELARLGQRIENHYKHPQDIEWAVENGKVYIVQARAVTTFKKDEGTTKSGKAQAPALLNGEIASKGTYSGTARVIFSPKELNKVLKGDILVTTMTTPDMVPAMERAGAIVTDEGGMTCHAAIVSREMGTPCLVGTEKATKVIKDGQLITVDAFNGFIYKGNVTVEGSAGVFATSNLKTKTKVKVIVDLPSFAVKAAATGADGVGLVRSEIMIAQGGIHPAEYIRTGKAKDYTKLLVTGIGKIAAAFAPRPIWVRTSDMRSDEYRNLKGGDKEPKETDPMIGWHGVRRQLDEPAILQAELQAFKDLYDKGVRNVGIMIPFVIRANEVAQAKALLRKVGLEPCKQIPFGIMVETPAACWVIEDICKEGISFVSFGTNDLTQLTLGIDRNNERIAKLFDEMHPAVVGEIGKVLETCKRYKVETSICGQAGSKPVMAEFLVRNGITSISANADAVGLIRNVVAEAEKKVGKK